MTRRRSSLRRRLAATSFVVAAIALASPALAGAAGELQVSTDGSRWATSYAGPLLAGDAPLTPRSERSGSVYLRNATAQEATLTVGIDAATTPRGVLVDVTLFDGTTVVASTTRSFAELATDPDLDLGDEVEARGTRRLDVSLRLDESLGNETQDQSIAFSVIVALQGQTIELPGTPEPGLPVPRGPLPRSGGDGQVWVVVATATMAAGITLRVVSRRRR